MIDTKTTADNAGKLDHCPTTLLVFWVLISYANGLYSRLGESRCVQQKSAAFENLIGNVAGK